MGKAKKIIPILVALLIVPVGIYTISPFFINTTVDEAIPLATAGNEIVPVFSGTFAGVGDGVHDVQGVANVIKVDDSTYLRFENFAAANGPDLHVYLATDDEASEFVDLGVLKANNGNQNYEISKDIDLEKYDKVLVWCQMFSVLFGSAELQ
jgi:hypothetical protein